MMDDKDIEDYLASTGVATRDAEGNLTQAAKDFGQQHLIDFGAAELLDPTNVN